MASVAEYFALKKAANPNDRNIQGIQTMMGLNARNQDPYGMSGLANLPLSFALGRANRDAAEFDQNTADKADSFMQQEYQQHKEKQQGAANQAATSNLLSLLKEDVTAANDYFQNNPLLRDKFSPGFKFKEPLNKESWTTVEAFSADGKTKNTYQLNIGGLPEAGKRFTEAGGTGAMTGDDLEKFMPAGWLVKFSGAAKTAPDPKAPQTREVQRGDQSVTEEYNTDTGTWHVVGKGPKWSPKAESTGATAEQKGFREWATEYGSLIKARANVEKGLDPITGQMIPQTQIETAKATLNGLIAKTERHMQATFPNEWKTYGGTATPQPAAPQPITATNPTNGQRIVSYDNGKSWQPAR